MNIFAISSLSVTSIGIILIFLILIFGKTSLQKMWGLFNISVAVWGIGCFMVSKAVSQEFALLGWQIALSGGVFISTTFYNTVCIFCNIKRNKFLIFAYCMDFLFVFVVNMKTQILLSGWNTFFGNIYYLKATILYIFALSAWVSIACLGLYELFNFLIRTKGLRHIQAIYFFFGSLAGFIGGTTIHLPLFGIPIYPIGNFGVLTYTIVATYAILKYRLMDINVAIARGAIFSIVYTLVLGIPFGLMGWGRSWLIDVLGQNWIWAPMLTLLFFATSGPYLFMYLQRKALNRILAEEKRAHNLLLTASKGMTQIRNLNKLLKLIVHFISRALKTKNTQVFLLEGDSKQYSLRSSRSYSKNIFNIDVKDSLAQYLKLEKQPLVQEELAFYTSSSAKDSLVARIKHIETLMKNLDASVIIPCLVENNLLGFLALGEKASGRMYTQDDLNVLVTLANQAALAIENAQFYEEVQRTQEQLFQAEKMATLGTMADGLSHQINNRFNALGLIAGDTIDTLNMMHKDRLDTECANTLNQVQNALKRIEENVKSGGEIVKGLLKYSRPGQEGFDLVPLDQIVTAALEMAQYKIKLNEIDIKRNYDSSSVKIKANLVQLQEVFFNLIDNAYFAMKQRKDELKEENYKGEIVISAEQIDGQVRIKVSDNGMGVRKEDFDKLFTPFFTTKATANKGTGLGLFVIQKIITNNHKGKISVESHYKQGTTFIIELPA